MCRLLADGLVREGPAGFAEAADLYRASLESAAPLAEKLQISAQLVRLYGTEMDRPQKAEEVLKEAEKAVEEAGLSQESRPMFRRVLIAAGDARLSRNKTEDAGELYQRAETLSGRPIPAQVRAARAGAYPNSLASRLQPAISMHAGTGRSVGKIAFQLRSSRDIALSWRGKVLLGKEQLRGAVQALTLAARLTVGSESESEVALAPGTRTQKSGQPSAAHKEWSKLAASGIEDVYVTRDRAKLKSKP